jgi:O-antigen ligase
MAALALALIVGAAGRPLLAAGVLAGAACAAFALAWLARRFGVGGLLMLAIPFSVLAGELGSVGAGGQSGRILVVDAVVTLIAVGLLLRRRGQLAVPHAAFLAALAPFLAWCALGLLTCADPLTGIAELKEWCVAAVVGVAALVWTRDVARARLLLGGVVVTSAAIAAAMLVVVLRHPMGPVLAVMLRLVDLPWGRSNYLAGFFILAIPLALGLAWSGRSSLAAWAWGGLAAMSGMGLVLSASKGAMLSLVLTLLPAFATAGRGARRAALPVLVLLGAVALVYTNGPLQQVMSNRLTSSAIDYSMSERVDLYWLAWQEFLAHPILGIGLNNFSVVSHLLRGLDTVPHNLELGWLAELGLPGALLGLAVVLAPLRSAWRVRVTAHSPAERAVAAGLLAAWAGVIAHNQVESTIYGGQFKIVMLLLAAATWAFERARAGPPIRSG